jgi:CheY-like chemotaxis protein
VKDCLFGEGTYTCCLDRNRTILIAEDDENYIILLEKALRDIGRPSPVHTVRNGDEAINYLSAREKYADRAVYEFPAVLFLDLKMPGTGGFDVLRWMQQHPQHKVTPTLVLSGSALERDAKQTYELGANAYLEKPSQFEDLKTMLNDAYRFWAWCVKPAVLGEKE